MMSSEETVPLWRQEFWAEMLCAGQPNETAICVYTLPLSIDKIVLCDRIYLPNHSYERRKGCGKKVP